MRLGLLGLGRIGAFHAETLAGLPAVEELVISDPVPALAEQAAGRLGARIVLDAIETGWVAEACTLSLREHRPVQIRGSPDPMISAGLLWGVPGRVTAGPREKCL